MISMRSEVLVIRSVISLTLAKCETLSGHFRGNLRTMRADLIMAWLQPQPTRERPDTFRRTVAVGTPRALHGRGGPYTSCQQILQGHVVEHRFGEKLLELRVLVLERLQPPGLRDVEPAGLRLPGVERGLADPVPPTLVRCRCTGLLLAQDRNDLLFREPRSLHRPVLPGSGLYPQMEEIAGGRSQGCLPFGAL